MDSPFIILLPFLLTVIILYTGIAYLRYRHYHILETEAKQAFHHLVDTHGFQNLGPANAEYENMKKELIFHRFWGDAYRENPAKDLGMLIEKSQGSRKIYVEAEAHRPLRFTVTFRRVVFYRPVLIIPIDSAGILEDDLMVIRHSLRYIDVTGRGLRLKNAIEGFESKFLLRGKDRNRKEISLPPEIQSTFLAHCGKYPLDGREDMHNITSPQNVMLAKNGIAITARPSTEKEIIDLIDFGTTLADQIASLKGSVPSASVTDRPETSVEA